MQNGILDHVEAQRDGVQDGAASSFQQAHYSQREELTATGSSPPKSGITGDCDFITPQMLPMVELDQEQIDALVQVIPGGARNVQDIYPLAPLQEGMLFHHLLNEQGDAYILSTLFELQPDARLHDLVSALQSVIVRHDVLRSAVLWENLPRPVQVVQRHVALSVERIELDPTRDVDEQLAERMQSRRPRFDVRRAPLMRLECATNTAGRHYVLLHVHHLICDHQSLRTVVAEALSCLGGREHELPCPAPFRNYVAYARMHAREHDAETFFRSKLGDIDEPTAPFGLLDVHGGGQIEEFRETLDSGLAQQIRTQAQRSGVSPARLFHVAWALVVGHTSGRDDVVFGTVLLARLQKGAQAQRMLGLSVNTLPLRLRLRGVTIGELVALTHRELAELLAYEQVPLIRAQRFSGIEGTAPLFSTILNYRRSLPQSEIDGVGVAGIHVRARSDARTNYPIALTIDDLGEGFALTVQSDLRIAPQRIAAHVQAALQSVLHALEFAPQTAALELSALPAVERRQVIELFNATAAAYPRDRLVHEVVEEQVERTPEAIAARHGDRSLTYRELNERANRLARHLRRSGVASHDVVAICVDRGFDMVVGLLGILKAGAAYLPVDPNYPAERIEYMLRDAAPRIVLTQEELRGVMPPTAAAIIALDTLPATLANLPAANLPRAETGLTSASLLYLIYTSGSTGRPKGTAMPHGSMINLIEWHRQTLPDCANRAVLQFAALSFDVAFQETFTTLATGGVLVLLEEWIRKDARELVRLLNDVAVERLFLPPLMLQTLAECVSTTGEAPTCLREVITAGEQLRITPEMVRLFKLLPGCRLHNHYGPTETHVVTSLTLEGAPEEWPLLPTIGRPIANTQMYILDSRRQPVPLGVVGEIYIGGANLAHGYRNRPELTAERFVRNPFRTDPAARLYKTGDLGRWRTDGTIEFLGRNDDQVKIRGFRVELGEVEARLGLHEHVKEAAVIVREDGPGGKRLVAYVTPRESGAPNAEQLREHVKGALPEYMVPSAFVVLDSLPLTPSGKLNRRALPAPDLTAYVSREYQAPQGEVEEILAGIWQSLLKVERVGRHDNFFELGGHSLLIVQLKERLRRFGLSTELRNVFDSSTLAHLATALTREAVEQAAVPPNMIPAGCTAITPQMLPLVELEQQQIDMIAATVPGGTANVQDIYPLAPLQEGILFHHLLNEAGGDTYLVFILLAVESRAQLDQLIAAFQSVIDRHDILRTAILWEGLPRAVQVVYRNAQLPVQQVEMRPGRDPVEQMREWIKPERQRLDLRRAPLMRLQVAPDSQGPQWYAVLQLHHMTIDHMALEIITSEAVAHLAGRSHALPAAAPYRDHVAQALAYARKHDAESFFRAKLGDVDEPTAPFDLLDVYGTGTQIDEARQELDPLLAQRIRAQARRMGVSAATLFHAAWGLVIAHTSARDDVVFGSLLLGRLQGSAGAQLVLGMFINTLPVRLRLRGMSAKDLVEHTQRELVDLLAHEQASLAVAQRCSAITGGAPLFTALLNYRHNVVDLEREWLNAPAVRMLGLQDRTNYPIIVSVDDPGEGFALTAQTDRRIDPQRMIGYLHTAMQSLLDVLERAPQTLALTLPILPDDERRRVVELFNDTAAPYPRAKLLHELFEEQVERTPHEVAVVSRDSHLTYRQLNCRANQLARLLRARGARPDRFVGLCVERGIDMVLGVLGILKAGSAYAPLDPSYPRHRIEYILKDAAPLAVLTQERLKDGLPAESASIALDSQWDEISSYPATNLQRAEVGADSNNLAYVIYTSGSTGQPKGVAIEHRNAVNLVWWAQSALSPEMFEETLHSTSLNFDLSVYECFVPLSLGGCLRVLPNALELLREPGRVTLINTVPSAIKAILDSGSVPDSTRVVNLAGEALKRELVERIFASSAVERVCNLYGPSETTTYSTWVEMSRKQGFNRSIGRPIANTQVYILDRQRQPVPVGVVGEIYIGGAGVARGYLNRAELTGERFLPNPFSADPQARMYRTGDVARWLMDGTIEYLGRNDHQVKVRGFRIELGEIEALLLRHEQVKEAVVIAREDVPGDKRLVAYVVAESSTGTVATASAEALRSHLKAVLPEFMLPNAFVMLERLPLNSNGKLDRRALPAPELSAYASQAYEAPLGEIEEVLAGIWQALLRVERVGRRDNFFELGGHSLLIMQMMERLRRVGLQTELRQVFDSATLADLAAVLTQEAVERYEVPANRIPPACEAVTPAMLPLVDLKTEHIERIARAVPGGMANIQDIYPLAPIQEGILFHHMLDEHRADTYVLALVLSVATRALLQRLVAGLQAAIDRHDVLRTAVLWRDLPAAVQVVQRRATLSVEESPTVEARTAAEQIEAWTRPEFQRVDLTRAPLLRLRVAEDRQSGRLLVLLQLHHMTVDHVTLEIVTSEVVAHVQGCGQLLPDSVPYRDHVAQALTYARRHDAEAFFRNKLADVDEPTAPFGLLDVHGDGTQIEQEQSEFPAALALRVRAQARRMGVSAATLFHCAWAMVVAHTSGRDDIVFGTVLLGRLQAARGSQRILGMFINTLPLRLQLDNMTAKGLVDRVQRELVELLTHEQASLAAAQRCSGIQASAPLFTTLFNYRHSSPDPHKQWSAVSGVEVLASRERTNYPITCSVDDLGQGFVVTAKTHRRIVPRRLIDYLQTAMAVLIDALDQAPQTPALALSILPHAERHLVSESFNATRAAYPQQLLVHQLFEHQVRRSPDRTAVICGDRSLSYAQLNCKANQLARHLRSRGAGPDRLIAICVDRSLDMIIGLLAILKSGSAYVPLDPDYPRERLEYMLTDAAPTMLLAQGHLRERPLLSYPVEQTLWLDGDWGNATMQDAEQPDPGTLGLRSDHLAYVIYTSGSTGKPKGVMIEHRNVMSLWQGLEHIYASSPCERVAVNASFTFDASVKQLIQLLSGRTLVLVPQHARADADAMLRFIGDQRVECIDCTPAQLKAWIAAGLLRSDSCALRLVLVGGEPIESELWMSLARCSRVQFCNVYGPTESTVDATFARLDGDLGAPHIGRPMENRQIYIVDRHGWPVPLGVAGEMWVGGAGVARGYLNRPELTAQRFIADPFKDEPHARLYRTGDVARWREDGVIEYVGRNDNQVKVRGIRIELGEVESQLASLAQVDDAVVIACTDAIGEQRLVAYVVPGDAYDASELSAEVLRARLRTMLPEYMIPSAFVVMKSLPLTAGGKLDRRALPAPEIGAYASRSYEPPQDDRERVLAEIWQNLLGVERVGLHDNVFDLGAHSLVVLRGLLMINERLAANLRVADVYACPTIAELATRIRGDAVVDALLDLASEAELEPQIAPRPAVRRTLGGAIMLTGSTGFVGRFLLAQLLRDTDGVIYCLVRAQTKIEAAARLIAVMSKWDLWRDEFESRVIAVPGDLRQPRLGLDDTAFALICHNVDTIYHCATSMNHLETYATAKSANVGSAREILRIATCERLKLVNYVSTLSVFVRSATAARVIDESSSIDREPHRGSNGYAASKWVAEKIFMTAGERGVPCNVFRLGLVWADSQQGRYDELQRVYRIMKSSLLTGIGIRGYRTELPPTPVDYAARSIVFLASRYRDGQGIFHISSARPMADGLFERCNEVMRTELRLLPYYDWIREVKRLHAAGRSLPVVPLIEFAFSMDAEAFDEWLRQARGAGVRFDLSRTHAELEQAGISAPVLNDDLLSRCVGSMIERDPELSGAAPCEELFVFSGDAQGAQFDDRGR